MPIVDQKGVLKALTVREAMRRLVCHLDKNSTIRQAIRNNIKYKINAVLITDESGDAVGVVSKTNILGAYYAGLPVSTPLEFIMVAPPLFCHVDDSLDHALDMMRNRKVHRLYVHDKEEKKAIGVLAYPDILGILYRYCHRCERNTLRSRDSETNIKPADHFKVHELMNPSFQTHYVSDTLMQILETIPRASFKTVLILDATNAPTGVIATTDLVLAYLHGVPLDESAKTIMTTPVRSCNHDDRLILAIQQMVFLDLHSLYVYKEKPENIVGIISLSDAARVRSGSCRACMVTRIIPES